MATQMQIRTKQARAARPPVTPTEQVQEVLQERKTSTITDTEIQPVQSLEIVQTLMLASFSTLCYIRGLLPEEAFEDRGYESVVNERLQSNGAQPKRTDAVPSSSASRDGKPPKPRYLKILARGHSLQAGKIHAWLESIFDALKQKYLHSVQLCVLPDRENRQNVIEAYTLTIEYTQDSLYQERQIDGIVISRDRGRKVTIKNARNGLDHLIRNLIVLTESLPYLPEKRFLTIYLAYVPECPDGYHPKGFKANTEFEMMVPDTDVWKMTDTSLGSMDSGFHKVSMSVSAMQAALAIEGDASKDLQIPTTLPFTRVLPHLPPVPSLEPFTQALHEEIRQHSIANPLGKICPLFKEVPLGSLADREKVDAEIAKPVADATHAQAETAGPDEIDISTRMGSRSPISEVQNEPQVTLSQSIGQGHNKMEDISQSQSAQQNGRSHQLQEQHEISDGTWRLSTAKDLELYGLREQYLQGQNTAESVDSVKHVSCACGFSGQDSDMVQCDACDELQHQPCHALNGKLLQPGLHVCYSCLLLPGERRLFSKMQTVSRKRRLLWILGNTENTPSDMELGKLLNCQAKTVNGFIRSLIEGSLVRRVSQPKRKRRLVVNDAKVKANVVNLGFLNPMFLIQHHYEWQRHGRLETASTGADNRPRAPSESLRTDDGTTDELVALGPSSSSQNHGLSQGPSSAGRVSAGAASQQQQQRGSQQRRSPRQPQDLVATTTPIAVRVTNKRPAPEPPSTPKPRKSQRSGTVATPLTVNETW